MSIEVKGKCEKHVLDTDKKDPYLSRCVVCGYVQAKQLVKCNGKITHCGYRKKIGDIVICSPMTCYPSFNPSPDTCEGGKK